MRKSKKIGCCNTDCVYFQYEFEGWEEIVDMDQGLCHNPKVTDITKCDRYIYGTVECRILNHDSAYFWINEKVDEGDILTAQLKYGTWVDAKVIKVTKGLHSKNANSIAYTKKNAPNN